MKDDERLPAYLPTYLIANCSGRTHICCCCFAQANADVLAELERLRSEADPVAAAAQRRDEQAVDLQKFEQLIANLQARLAGACTGVRPGRERSSAFLFAGHGMSGPVVPLVRGAPAPHARAGACRHGWLRNERRAHRHPAAAGDTTCSLPYPTAPPQGLRQTLGRKLAEKQSDLKARQDQIAPALAEIEGLRQRVASQTVNKADLNRMILERCVNRPGAGWMGLGLMAIHACSGVGYGGAGRGGRAVDLENCLAGVGTGGGGAEGCASLEIAAALLAAVCAACCLRAAWPRAGTSSARCSSLSRPSAGTWSGRCTSRRSRCGRRPAGQQAQGRQRRLAARARAWGPPVQLIPCLAYMYLVCTYCGATRYSPCERRALEPMQVHAHTRHIPADASSLPYLARRAAAAACRLFAR